MLQYQVWLNTLPASEQFELREKPVDERVQQIVAQQRREANNPWIKLSPEEFRRLSNTMGQIREQLTRDMSIQNRDENRGPNNRARNQSFAQQVRRQFNDRRDEWFPEILSSLSDANRAKLEQLEPVQQQRQIVRWIMESRNRDEGRRVGQRRPFDLISQQELERFFAEETDGPTKERLLAMPRDKMEQQLKRLYFRSALPEGDRPGDFRPGDRPMGPPPRGDRGGYGPRRGGPGFGPPRERRPEGGPDFGRPNDDLGPPRDRRDDDRGPPPPPDATF
jgi:hypothetical protein